jgi:hypothetical protein
LREWRNGRRASFRCWCPKGRGGSSPPSRTTKRAVVLRDLLADQGIVPAHSRDEPAGRRRVPDWFVSVADGPVAERAKNVRSERLHDQQPKLVRWVRQPIAVLREVGHGLSPFSAVPHWAHADGPQGIGPLSPAEPSRRPGPRVSPTAGSGRRSHGSASRRSVGWSALSPSKNEDSQLRGAPFRQPRLGGGWR